MFRIQEFHAIEDAISFMEQELAVELKKAGLKEVEADCMDYKRWFAKSFRCPVSAEELKQEAEDLKEKILVALREEKVKNFENVTFNIKNVEYIQDNDTGVYLVRGTINFEEDEVKEVPPAIKDKFIVKSCYHLSNSVYADGREAHNECGNSLTDKKCADVDNCYLKQIAQNLLKVVNANVCNNCDGCGYEWGCADEDCGTYAAHKCLDLLRIEFED